MIKIAAPVEVIVQQPTNPCIPSPCGPNSECRNIGQSPACSCKLGYIGSPPNCRPECVINSDCQSHLACILEKCREPCIGSCGLDADCKVINHTPVCSCPDGFTGDPFTRCTRKPPRKLIITPGLKPSLIIYLKYSGKTSRKRSLQSIAMRTKCKLQ